MRNKLHIIIILALNLTELVLPCMGSTGISFYGFEQPLDNEWEMAGEAQIITDNPRGGEYCLKLGTMGKAILPVSENNVYGKVSFWVKDSKVQFPANDSASIGPVFGLQNKDGNMLLFGILRRDYLDGTKYGYLLTAENNFYGCRYSPDLNRTAKWQKWTIEVTGPGVINIYINDKLKTINNSVKHYFSGGFTEIYFRGDAIGPEEFCFDDVTVEISGEGQTDEYEFPEPRVVTNTLKDPNFFPIAVWAQALDYIDYFKALGVNIFIGEGAKETTQTEFLDALHSKGLYGIILPGKSQDAVDHEIISQFKNHPALLAWRHRDEPDILSTVKQGLKSPPRQIKEIYEQIGTYDKEHSVYLNFNPGVGGDPTRRHAQAVDYYEYCEGADIISYDIYPISSYPNGEKLLYTIADGIDRLKDLSDNKKPIWIWLEARKGDLNNGNRYPTPREMRAEAWMSIIHGADGIGWFAQLFEPFRWHDISPELEKEMTNIAHTLQVLAPAIKSSERDDVGLRKLSQGRIDITSRIYGNKLYFFAINMMDKEIDVEFILPSQYSGSGFKIINENRTVQISKGIFKENFAPYEVHLYEQINAD